MSTKSSKPNVSADGIPEPGECSPMYYQAMTPEQRAEYDRRCDEAKAYRAKIAADIHDLNEAGLFLAWIAARALHVPVIGKPIVGTMTAVIKVCNAVRGLFDSPEGA